MSSRFTAVGWGRRQSGHHRRQPRSVDVVDCTVAMLASVAATGAPAAALGTATRPPSTTTPKGRVWRRPCGATTSVVPVSLVVAATASGIRRTDILQRKGRDSADGSLQRARVSQLPPSQPIAPPSWEGRDASLDPYGAMCQHIAITQPPALTSRTEIMVSPGEPTLPDPTRPCCWPPYPISGFPSRARCHHHSEPRAAHYAPSWNHGR